MSNFIEKIFSVKNDSKKIHKIITILGLKLKFKFHEENDLINKPFGLIIDTTLLCNNHCSFCWRSNYPDVLKKNNKKYKTKTMSIETYKKIIDDAVQYDHIKWLSLCGPMGEPLMNDKIEDFFEYAYKKNHFRKISINTNGLAINKKDIGRLLNSIHEFSVSVDSIIPETYEKIHGHKNLNQVIDNIKSLVEYKKKYGCVADIYVRFTENVLNRGQFPEFKNFFEEIGIDYINYTQEHSFAGVNKSLNNTKTVATCIQPSYIINFNFLGDMTACCIDWHLKPKFGNIKNRTIKQMWNSKNKQIWNSKKRFTQIPCRDCSGLGKEVQHSQIIVVRKELV